MTDYFAFEALLLARLSTIPGLLVKSVTDVDDKTILNAVQPTAVVVFQGDDRKDANDEAILIESRWTVSLFVRSGVKERGAVAGQLLAKMLGALHGWCPGDGFDTLQWQGTVPDSHGNGSLQEYAMVFSVDATVYTNARS